MRTIRARVAFTVFGVVFALLGLQGAYILDRVEHGLRKEVDQFLLHEFEELSPLLGTPELARVVANDAAARQRWNELFVEVIGPDGAVEFRSPNVPTFGRPELPRLRDGDPASFGERMHPRSRKGNRRVRYASARVGDYELRVGQSIERMQTTYRRLRANLVAALGVIASLGAFAAYAVAARALAPVTRIAERARALGASPDGLLPRTGNRDEIDRLAEVLNELLARVRDEIARVRRLTADAAHALRTPLAALRGTLEVQAARAAPEVAEELGAAIEQVDDLARSVRGLLQIERLAQAPQEALELERLELGALVRGVSDAWSVLANERGIALESRIADCAVEADPNQLRQALSNLLDNALRHTPSGGRVELEVACTEKCARIRVRDSGPGLAADDLERVFERFYSRPGARGGGSGLGLPIARAIARAHGGELRASSPGGALFELELPLGPR